MTSSIFVSRACNTSSASMPCTAMVVPPFLPAELCVKSLAQLLHDSCLDAVYFFISQCAVISAIAQGEGQTLFANGYGLADIDVEQPYLTQQFWIEVLD